MNIERWTEEWPTEPGYYWFYGWRFKDRDYAPEINFVKIRTTANRKPMRVTGGHFLYPEEGGYGLWLSACLPYLPELSELKGEK